VALVVNLALPPHLLLSVVLRNVSKLLLRCRNGTDRQTDRWADTLPLNKPCSTYYAGSADKTTDL